MSPLYEFECQKCGEHSERLTQMGGSPPVCCGAVMSRAYSGSVLVLDSRSLTGKKRKLWLDRLNDIHKAQADRGERLRLPHPSEVL